MSAWDYIKKESPNHKVKHLSGGAFRIMPLGESAGDLERFQPVAQIAIAVASAEGRYCLPRLINRHSVDGYLSVVIRQDKSPLRARRVSGYNVPAVSVGMNL